MAKTKINEITVVVGESANVTFWRANKHWMRALMIYRNVTPSSIRRAQRAQLALMERGQAE